MLCLVALADICPLSPFFIMIKPVMSCVSAVSRGAVSTWRPKITPMSQLKPSELQTHTLPGEAPPVQRTSLAANQQVSCS